MYGLLVTAPTLPKTVTVPQVPLLPAPMLFGEYSPLVTVSLVTPEVMVMSPQEEE